MGVEETIRRIEECRSWMVLKNVEQDPEYAELLNQCLDEIDRETRPRIGPMLSREGFIFISSPRAITPYHMDPEHNFLLQIRGNKVVTQFSREDRDVVSDPLIERFYLSGSRNLEFKESYLKAATAYPLLPGRGLHFPVTVPHWVEVGDEYSVSFSITFRSEMLNRRETLYRINGHLRKLGLTPSPYGTSGFRDSIKYGTYRALRSIRCITAAPDRAKRTEEVKNG